MSPHWLPGLSQASGAIVCARKNFITRMFMSHLGVGINSTETGAGTDIPDADVSVAGSTSSG